MAYELKDLEPLASRKDPNIAALIGFLFGGIGLGIYLRSVIDAIVPIVVFVLVGAALAELGWLGGALFAAVYGYLRVQNSSARLQAPRQSFEH